jgi:hypothetical protein
VIHLDTPLGEQLLDVAVGQAEAQVPADRQHDHLGGEAVAREGGPRRDRPAGAVSGSHGRSLTALTSSQRTQQSLCRQVGRLGVRAAGNSGLVAPTAGTHRPYGSSTWILLPWLRGLTRRDGGSLVLSGVAPHVRTVEGPGGAAGR